jgi:hypothetical protein
MGLFKDGHFPWAVSLDDLDLITRFSPSADVFLHFIKRRIMLEKEEVRYAGSELDFFGTYLNSGRLEPDVWRHAEKRPDLITLTNYHERFQKAIHVESMGMPVLAPVPLNVPSIVKDFLGESPATFRTCFLAGGKLAARPDAGKACPSDEDTPVCIVATRL